ncbi:penicillin-binding protein 2 [Lysobacter silvisoli]|uniref:Peptidoglycan D,D-transpeptidase MrdA n=1 Tax=Lysobacter silvisoli TaxID=2293254 RepID=A0A371K0H9_9GAMM|nr:penicillin-binding protein 2 [Lysobacter silvisoli]RDZ27347.1 penicillin-binding protein 2 [Lysobacter silvisoli]
MGPRRRILKNPAAEAEQFRARAALAFAFVVLGVLGLGFWYYRLQVLQHADYVTRSEANRIKLRPVVPGRGLIYDRKGRILADNVPAFRIDVTPSEAGKTETWLPALSQLIALSPEDIQRYENERKASRGFKPITLKLRVSDEEAARFSVDRWRYPGVELVSYLNRRYPYGELFSHVIGYVGRIDSKDLETMGEGNAALTHTGKTGIERYYEQALRGKVGYEKIETNVDGRPMGQVGHVPAQPGADLRLSIDLDLQRAMVAAFGDFDGSAVAVDPRTGEVLAMVSLPGYDTNLFVNGISNADYRALMDNPSRPMFNRNVLGGGPPGSTVKPLIGLAGLDSGLRTPEDKVFSTGEFHIPGQKRGYRDAHGGAGWTDLRKSISQSVNYYYYKLAYEMGIGRFEQYMRKYGFGAPTGIDLAGENSGVVPSPAWKAKRNKKEGWYPGETVIAGIGQGYWIATALQLVRGTAAIANGGDLRRLHLVRERRDGYEAPWAQVAQPVPTRITDNAAHLRAVQEGMMQTMLPGGTGASLVRGAPYVSAGKTGTAQKISRRGNVSLNPHSLPYHLRHQALFVGYAPAENPTIAVAVVVEHGGYGASSAGPIARKIFDAWLLGKMPEPDPKSEPDPAHGDAIAPLAAPVAAALAPAGEGVAANTPAPVSPAFAVGALSREALAREAAKGHANAPNANAVRAPAGAPPRAPAAAPAQAEPRR